MKNNVIKLSEKQLKDMISESINRLRESAPNDHFVSSLGPDRSEEDLEEEEKQFYEQLGEYCYKGLDCFNLAIDLINTPYGLEHEAELKNILRNIKHICDRIENIWEEYAD